MSEARIGRSATGTNLLNEEPSETVDGGIFEELVETIPGATSTFLGVSLNLRCERVRGRKPRHGSSVR